MSLQSPKHKTGMCKLSNFEIEVIDVMSVWLAYESAQNHEVWKCNIDYLKIIKIYYYLSTELDCVLTLLKSCRRQSILPKLCITTGCWMIIIIVGTMRWISIGYAYQSNSSHRSFNSWNALFTCWPNSQTINVVIIDQIISMSRLINRKPLTIGCDWNQERNRGRMKNRRKRNRCKIEVDSRQIYWTNSTWISKSVIQRNPTVHNNITVKIKWYAFVNARTSLKVKNESQKLIQPNKSTHYKILRLTVSQSNDIQWISRVYCKV